MPKFHKTSEISPKKSYNKERTEDEFALRSVIISSIIGFGFLVLSFFFNGTAWFNEGIIAVNIVEKEPIWEIVDNTIKIAVILFAFFFMLISIGNYQELMGKPLDYKIISLLIILALIQTIRNLWVFLFTLIGIIAILIYFYFIQESK